jgi:plasmid stabilization system protein ParE
VEIVYRAEAELDVFAAYAWYDGPKSGLGAEFEQELAHVEELLRRHPEAFTPVHTDYRRALMRRFPYSVYYRPLDPNTLEIAAVLHFSEDVFGLDQPE